MVGEIGVMGHGKFWERRENWKELRTVVEMVNYGREWRIVGDVGGYGR